MKILYGVVGEGMGHATRSRVVLEHLVASGHDVFVVASGGAFEMLSSVYQDSDRVYVRLIEGLEFEYDGHRVDRSESLKRLIEGASRKLRRNFRVYRDLQVSEGAFAPEVVISDFESWSYLFGMNHFVPVISIDNIQVIHRCRHATAQTNNRSTDFLLAREVVRSKLPRAYHYLISSFFYPSVRKKRTSLVPPILRPEILAAERRPGEHIVVYLRTLGEQALVDIFKAAPVPVQVYGFDRDDEIGNIRFRPFSESEFVQSLASAKAVVAAGGYSLMAEAVHLGVPMLAVPIESQFEQELNCRYLSALGYGQWTRDLDAAVLKSFLQAVSDYEEALSGFERHDNQMLLDCVDALLRRVRLGSGGKDALDVPNMGCWTPRA